MKFKIGFYVDEAHLGPVMAALYRTAHIDGLLMSPIEEIDGQRTIANQPPAKKERKGTDKPTLPEPTLPEKKGGRGRKAGGVSLGDLIVAGMQKGVTKSSDMRAIAIEHGYSAKGLYSCIDKLIKQKRVTKVATGVYALSGQGTA